SSADVTVKYYNTCTGWALSWDLGSQARAGVAFQCPSGGPWTLTASDLAFDGTTRSGYGYTGTLGVYAADSAGCLVGAPLVWQPFLPSDGVNHYTWNISVPSSFVLACVTGGSSHPFVQRSRFVTDHPGHGPTGPPACGTCYSAARPTHSFYYGSGSVVLCPGTP